MSFLIGTLSLLMLAISLFMILLVLIQRGRGGGLAGAFGGMGGQSAFGTRAGDTFTRITIVLAVIWVLLAGGLGMMMRRDAEASKTGKNSKYEEGAEAGKKDETLIDSGELTSGDTDETKAAEPAKGDATTPADAKSDAAEATIPDAPKAEAATPEAEEAEPKTDEKASTDEKAAAPAEPAADAQPEAKESSEKAPETEPAKDAPAADAKP